MKRTLNLIIGDTFSAGEPLLEIETDKAQLAVEAPEDGILAKIVVSAGQRCPVGTVIALTAEEGDDLSNLKVPDIVTSPTASQAPPKQQKVSSPQKELSSEKSHLIHPKHSAPLSPAVLHLLSSNGIEDATEIKATGPKGRLLKGDVLAHLGKIEPPPPIRPKIPAEEAAASKKSSSSLPPPKTRIQDAYIDIPVPTQQQAEAAGLSRSKSTIPHSYIKKIIALDNLLKLRQTINEQLSTDITINDFFVKAASLALRDTPDINVRFSPDLDSLAEHVNDVDVSIKVARSKGLIRKADEKGLLTISELIKEIVEKAKEAKLSPDEYKGGSFSILNLGVNGVDDFTEIIDPPQASILTIGGTKVAVQIPNAIDVTSDVAGDFEILDYLCRKRPKATRSSSLSSDDTIDIIDYLSGRAGVSSPSESARSVVEGALASSVEKSYIVSAQLSIDERIVDAAVAAKFLDRFARLVEKPEEIFL